jgi:hypothetical protein
MQSIKRNLFPLILLLGCFGMLVSSLKMIVDVRLYAEYLDAKPRHSSAAALRDLTKEQVIQLVTILENKLDTDYRFAIVARTALDLSTAGLWFSCLFLTVGMTGTLLQRRHWKRSVSSSGAPVEGNIPSK